MTLMSYKLIPYELGEQMRSPKEIASFINAWLEEAPDDAAGFAGALGDIVRAKGASQIVRNAELGQENHHKAQHENGNPSFATVLKLARALGMRLHAEAA